MNYNKKIISSKVPTQEHLHNTLALLGSVIILISIEIQKPKQTLTSISAMQNTPIMEIFGGPGKTLTSVKNS